MCERHDSTPVSKRFVVDPYKVLLVPCSNKVSKYVFSTKSIAEDYFGISWGAIFPCCMERTGGKSKGALAGVQSGNMGWQWTASANVVCTCMRAGKRSGKSQRAELAYRSDSLARLSRWMIFRSPLSILITPSVPSTLKTLPVRHSTSESKWSTRTCGTKRKSKEIHQWLSHMKSELWNHFSQRDTLSRLSRQSFTLTERVIPAFPGPNVAPHKQYKVVYWDHNLCKDKFRTGKKKKKPLSSRQQLNRSQCDFFYKASHRPVEWCMNTRKITQTPVCHNRASRGELQHWCTVYFYHC